MQRITGLLLLEVRNSNPNGDPDRESDPRQRADGRGEISPVSYKRKLRDLVEDKAGAAWTELSSRFTPPLAVDEFRLLEVRGRDRDEIEKLVISDGHEGFKKAFWDARLFGSTYLEKEADIKARRPNASKDEVAAVVEAFKNNIRTGICQFGLGLSISAVEITRHTLTNKAGVESDKTQGMAPLAFRAVQHGLYAMPFFINPSTAHRSGCTQRDIDLMLHLLPFAYSNYLAMNRAGVSPVHIHVVTHANALGSVNDFKVIDALTPKRKGADALAPSTSIDDYTFPNVEEALKPFAGKVTHRDLAL